ncbi:hypothetical protein [Streptomyces sp. NPDC090025]|uniref:hypothetical protein n=1 Tax=Streptomyces sp. NPDC090025 TaxID=3365922 RepID=UPI0038389AB0
MAYDGDGDPGELLACGTEAAVADRLLGHFIRASAANLPEGERRYPPARAHRALAVIARGLGRGSAAETDLVLLAVGRRVPRWLLGSVVTVLMAAVVAGEGVLLFMDPSGTWAWGGWAVFLAVRFTVRTWRGRAVLESGMAVPRLGSPLWRVAGARALRSLTTSGYGVIAVLTCGGVVGLLVGLGETGLAEGALVGLLSLIASVLVMTVMEVDATTAGPTGVLRGKVLLLVLVGVAFTRVTSSVIGDDVLAALLSTLGLATAWVMTYLVGLLAYGLFLATHARRVPLRLARFLDWSVAAGLMRTSGATYQFRHREFQEWLVRHPAP